jgi:hypothetical protein
MELHCSDISGSYRNEYYEYNLLVCNALCFVTPQNFKQNLETHHCKNHKSHLCQLDDITCQKAASQISHDLLSDIKSTRMLNNRETAVYKCVY